MSNFVLHSFCLSQAANLLNDVKKATPSITNVLEFKYHHDFKGFISVQSALISSLNWQSGDCVLEWLERLMWSLVDYRQLWVLCCTFCILLVFYEIRFKIYLFEVIRNKWIRIYGNTNLIPNDRTYKICLVSRDFTIIPAVPSNSTRYFLTRKKRTNVTKSSCSLYVYYKLLPLSYNSQCIS